MHEYIGRPRAGTADVAPSLKVLVGTNHGGPGGVLLWFPIKGIPGSHARLTSAPHNFQHGCGCGDITLGNGVGGKRGNNGGYLDIIAGT